MALLMVNTIKTAELLNAFYTENYNKVWNVRQYPLATMRMEFQFHSGKKIVSFIPANSRTERMTNAHV